MKPNKHWKFRDEYGIAILSEYPNGLMLYRAPTHSGRAHYDGKEVYLDMDTDHLKPECATECGDCKDCEEFMEFYNSLPYFRPESCKVIPREMRVEAE